MLALSHRRVSVKMLKIQTNPLYLSVPLKKSGVDSLLEFLRMRLQWKQCLSNLIKNIVGDDLIIKELVSSANAQYTLYNKDFDQISRITLRACI